MNIAEIRAWATFGLALVAVALLVYLVVSSATGEGETDEASGGIAGAGGAVVGGDESREQLKKLCEQQRAKLLTTPDSSFTGGKPERQNLESQLLRNCEPQGF